MARAIHRLSAAKVASLAKPGQYSDGGGLYLKIRNSGGKFWIFRWSDMASGKRINREVRLGTYPATSLAKARTKASRCREIREDGGDPRLAINPPGVPTFSEVRDEYIETFRSSWSNAKHEHQWRQTLGPSYCAAILDLPVDRIATEDILAVLQPVWLTKHETARRLRSRLELVLDFAAGKKYRPAEVANPARWRSHLRHLLPPKPREEKKHYPAMPYLEVPAFLDDLRCRSATAALALEFTILTAARTSEVLEADWTEIDFENKVWTIPAVRMKLRKEHRVPLSPRALQVLNEAYSLGTTGCIFPGQRKGRPLSNMSMNMLLRRMGRHEITVHGFRSSFRDWAGNETSFPREIAEAALSHQVGNAVERSYRRSDALDKRRRLMDAWDAFVGTKATPTVVPLRA